MARGRPVAVTRSASPKEPALQGVEDGNRLVDHADSGYPSHMAGNVSQNVRSGKTLSQKVWDQHVVHAGTGDEPDLLYIDLHLIHEVTTPQAFDGLRLAGRTVRRPDLTLATADHNTPTVGLDLPLTDPVSARQLQALTDNCAQYGITFHPMGSPGQGIVHVIGPELGLTQPGMTVVCGDSHTSTHGAFGALAFGIGTSEVEHVLATQTLPARRPGTMAITVEGDLPAGVTAKDVILTIIGRIGTGGGGRPHRRVPGLRHPGPVDGGTDDRLQHVGGGRGQGGHGEPRRHHLRLARGAGPRSEGQGLGAGARRVADPRHRRRRRLRQGGRLRRRRPWSPTCRGAPTRRRSPPSTGGCPTPTPWPTRRRPRPAGGPSPTWASPPARRCAMSPSTPSSSARAPTPGWRTCGRRPRSSPVATSTPGCGPWSSPARCG